MSSSNNSETHRFFPSGDWEGFYLYDGQNEKHAMHFSLNFKNGIVTGSGSDDVGSFNWKGQYSTEAFNCTMTKYYSAHTILYGGDADENGIWGLWSHGVIPGIEKLDPELQRAIRENFTGGGFHIWPKKRESAKEEAELKEEVKVKVEAFPLKGP